MKVFNIKGNELGYIPDDKTGISWYVVDAVKNEKRTHTGEWAARAAWLDFWDLIERLHIVHLKKVYRSLGIDPATGRSASAVTPRRVPPAVTSRTSETSNREI